MSDEVRGEAAGDRVPDVQTRVRAAREHHTARREQAARVDVAHVALESTLRRARPREGTCTRSHTLTIHEHEQLVWGRGSELYPDEAVLLLPDHEISFGVARDTNSSSSHIEAQDLRKTKKTAVKQILFE